MVGFVRQNPQGRCFKRKPPKKEMTAHRN
ncbi:protein of unknown function (plasmid) [Azospirillum baldaniorum]|uniref:Uncharacterized protein n=1 Tax=Azospirillum baldaniorum TaxID=1064539 RepID=A0A9P1NQQ6_9PROT|nr:protein of unknown function [Azospirillum baldaniorum]